MCNGSTQPFLPGYFATYPSNTYSVSAMLGDYTPEVNINVLSDREVEEAFDKMLVSFLTSAQFITAWVDVR